MVKGYDTSQLFRTDILLRVRYLEAEISERLKEMECLSRIAKAHDERLKALKRLMTQSRTKHSTPVATRKTILGLIREFTGSSRSKQR